MVENDVLRAAVKKIAAEMYRACEKAEGYDPKTALWWNEDMDAVIERGVAALAPFIEALLPPKG